jgi:O-antigen ligase
MSQTRILLWILRLLIKGSAEQKLRRQSALTLLKVAEGARLSISGLIFLFVALQVIGLSFVLSLVTAAFLLPVESDTRAWIIFGLGFSLFAVPTLGLSIALSGRLWLKSLLRQQWIARALEDKS